MRRHVEVMRPDGSAVTVVVDPPDEAVAAAMDEVRRIVVECAELVGLTVEQVAGHLCATAAQDLSDEAAYQRVAARRGVLAL